MVVDPFNRWGVTGHQGTVLILQQLPVKLEPAEALQLAAWLIVGAELAAAPEAFEGEEPVVLVAVAVDAIKEA
jgi:hypothetical protein